MARSSSKPRRGGAAQFIVRPLIAALVASGVIASGGLHAATIVVTTGGDAGNAGTCTLRQAVGAMNAASTTGTGCGYSGSFTIGDTVTLTGLSGTITLVGAAEIPVDVGMEINGPGATLLAVSGANASRVFRLNTSSTVTVRDLTVSNGRSAGLGGCIIGLEQQGDLVLERSAVTGCRALHDSNYSNSYLNGIGGGVAVNTLTLMESTVSGNTAENAGGGAFAKYLFAYRSSVSNNTVTGRPCNLSTQNEYCVPTFLGGGGILAGTAQLAASTVSGNTVNASPLTIVENDVSSTYLLGWGGGISQKYGVGIVARSKAGAKSTLVGNADGSARAKARDAFRAASARFATSAAGPRGRAGARAKADGYGYYIVALASSTVSGNRVQGNGTAPGKYSGGGIFAFSEDDNHEIVNSTISGNSLGSSPQTMGTYGSAMFLDSVEMSNSTITGNVGDVGVAIKYSGEDARLTSKASTQKGRGMASLAAVRAKVAQARSAAGLAGKGGKAALAKADGPSLIVSTIIAGNGSTDIECGSGCQIYGSYNLVRNPDSGVSLPGDTIVGVDPQLAPLANNGGWIAGAPGVAGTGPVRTHLLYIGSPAINAGTPEGFEYEQRGPGFPRVVGAAADIGATEGAIPRPLVQAVPALGPWMLGLLSALLGALGLARRRRKS